MRSSPYPMSVLMYFGQLSETRCIGSASRLIVPQKKEKDMVRYRRWDEGDMGKQKSELPKRTITHGGVGFSERLYVGIVFTVSKAQKNVYAIASRSVLILPDSPVRPRGQEMIKSYRTTMNASNLDMLTSSPTFIVITTLLIRFCAEFICTYFLIMIESPTVAESLTSFPHTPS